MDTAKEGGGVDKGRRCSLPGVRRGWGGGGAEGNGTPLPPPPHPAAHPHPGGRRGAPLRWSPPFVPPPLPRALGTPVLRGSGRGGAATSARRERGEGGERRGLCAGVPSGDAEPLPQENHRLGMSWGRLAGVPGGERSPLQSLKVQGASGPLPLGLLCLCLWNFFLRLDQHVLPSLRAERDV